MCGDLLNDENLPWHETLTAGTAQTDTSESPQVIDSPHSQVRLIPRDVH